MKASELAYKAAQEMAERGHCKKISEDSEGRVCFYGAVSRAEGVEPVTMITGPWGLSFLSVTADPFRSETPERAQLVEAVKVVLKERGVPEWEHPHQWNDLPHITGEDVILLFKEAGAKLEAWGC